MKKSNVPVHALPTVRRIAEELCRERSSILTAEIWSEAVNLWFQGYRPSLDTGAARAS